MTAVLTPSAGRATFIALPNPTVRPVGQDFLTVFHFLYFYQRSSINYYSFASTGRQCCANTTLPRIHVARAHAMSRDTAFRPCPVVESFQRVDTKRFSAAFSAFPRVILVSQLVSQLQQFSLRLVQFCSSSISSSSCVFSVQFISVQPCCLSSVCL